MRLAWVMGGVSSFGYSGTIAHAVLRVSSVPPPMPLHGQCIFLSRRSFPWWHPRPLLQHSMRERANRSNKAQRKLDAALASIAIVPALAEAAIVGAGLAGLTIAASFAVASVDPLAIIEKSATAGGTWRHFGNAFSRVNSSEPAYRLPVSHTRPNTNHSHHSEILSDVLRHIKQYGLMARIHTHAEVCKVAPSPDRADSWLLVGRQNSTGFTLACGTAVLCTNRRLGRPRDMPLSGEEVFGGAVKRGLSGDVNTLQCARERIVIVGMGAFAIENMRTSFERGAAHVTVLCRRRGTVCPQIIDWVNFIRPFDDKGTHDRIGDAVVIAHWQRAYDLAGATRPECWQEGLLKPDGHTVSVSDMFYLAHHTGMLMTQLGEVDHLGERAVCTRTDERLEAGIVIKCVGFHTNGGNEMVLGRAGVRIVGPVARNLWMSVEAHLDSRALNSPFGSSYLNGTAFGATLMLRYYRNPEIAQRYAQAEIPLVRMNYLSASDALLGSDMAAAIDPEVASLLRSHLESVAAAFHAAMSSKEYVTENQRLWDATRKMLLPRARTSTAAGQLAYPFVGMFDELPDLADELKPQLASMNVFRHTASVGMVSDDRAVASRCRVPVAEVSLPEVLVMLTETAGGGAAGADADTPLLDAGFDSISAMELHARLGKAAGMDLPVALVLEAPTARQLVAAVQKAQAELQSVRHLDPPPRLRLWAGSTGLVDNEAAARPGMADFGLRWLRAADTSSPWVLIPGIMGSAGRLAPHPYLTPSTPLHHHSPLPTPPYTYATTPTHLPHLPPHPTPSTITYTLPTLNTYTCTLVHTLPHPTLPYTYTLHLHLTHLPYPTPHRSGHVQ